MSNSAIATRYARALLAIATTNECVERYGSELADVAAILKREDMFRLLLDSPTFPLLKKMAMVEDFAAQTELSEGMTQFLKLLLEKGRINSISPIEHSYRKFADDQSGIVRARITAAKKLTKARSEGIRKGLEKKTGKKVILDTAVDADLIGGMQAEMDGRLFDGSVRTQLKRLSDALAKG